MRTLGIFWAFALMCVVVKASPNATTEDKISEKELINLNTPIRVLLEKQTSYGAAKSDRQNLYLSDGNSKWRKIGPSLKLHVETKNGLSSLFLNESPIKSRAIYLRGGPIASDILSYKGKKYRGALRITLRQNRFDVVNVLAIEDYLEGMLASEMSPHWEIEALKAQAVAARSYAVYMVRHPKNALYDLEAGTQDQVYGGVEKETPKVRTAIRETTGIYLGLEREPIKAFFHSRCGGLTETAQSVWRFQSPAHRHRVSCPYCQKKSAPWQITFNKENFFNLLKVPYQKGSPFTIAPQMSPSGRVSELLIKSSEGERKISSDEFRALLGYSKIKSAYFDWKIGKEAIFFEGRGNGHGVGMCQWGARQLAKEGRSFHQILSHFYPNVSLYEHGKLLTAALTSKADASEGVF